MNPGSQRRFWLCFAAMLAVGIVVTSWIVSSSTHDSPLKTQHSSPQPTAGLPWFVDVTTASGIDFRHFDSATPMHYIQETLGSGLAWIDYDNDGWPDLFCVQDGPIRPIPTQASTQAGEGRHEGSLPTSKLYRNNGNGTFTDVTEQVGLARSGFGLGCAVGDYDNDGFDDLLVTYWGGVVLYHNEPDGRGGRHFVDVTAKAGLRNPHMATSCAWGDIDGDGLLDLYICNYVEVDLDMYPVCEHGPKRLIYTCPPFLFPAAAHQLYRNNGDGTFTDISVSSGIAAVTPAPGLGVIMVDLDGDGRLDIYVANDMKPAYLFHNQGDGRFSEKAVLSGCGLGPNGRDIAGMGVDAADIDGSGRPSLFVTNFQNSPNILFRNRGGLAFDDWNVQSGLGPTSLNRLGFGTVFFDADLDGHLDVAIANGHINRNSQEIYLAPFAQEAQIYLGNGRGRFREITAEAGEYFRHRYVGRGLAWADYDNDGKADLAYSHNGGAIALLHNRTNTPNGWLRLELVGDGLKSNRNAIGARVEIECDGSRQVRFLNGGGSYLSASDRRLLIGLGAADRAQRVTVRWPSGRKQVFLDLACRCWWRLHEGKDQPELVIPRPAG
jgi:hypothetical protein